MKTKLLRKLRKKFYIDCEHGEYTAHANGWIHGPASLKQVRTWCIDEMIKYARVYYPNHRTRKRILV